MLTMGRLGICIMAITPLHALVTPRHLVKLAGLRRTSPIVVKALDAPLVTATVATVASVSPDSLVAWDPTGLARYSWWVIIAVLFGAQAKVCDDYFVPAIEACSKQLKIPDDVAGATLMAFGCNGPELFVNAIALFITHSDVGTGTIVGSEIFNLLCIVGGSVLVAPLTPLPVERYAFTRDTFFYAIATLLLGVVLGDGSVTRDESLGLVAMAGVYAIAVKETPSILAKFGIQRCGDQKFEAATDQGSFQVPVGGSSSSSGGGAAAAAAVTAMTSGAVLFSPTATTSSSPPSSFTSTIPPSSSSSSSSSPQSSSSSSEAEADEKGDECRIECGVPLPKGVRSGLVFECAPLEVDGDDNNDGAVKEEASSSLGMGMGGVGAVAKNGIAAVSGAAGSAMELVLSPLDLALAATVPDCKVGDKMDAPWAPAFAVSMVWLAVFSYVVCVVADQLTVDFGIPSAVVGLTVAAVGTSFANLWSSLIEARKGKVEMAVANALGSNIQNVFLALAVPWCLRLTLLNPDGAASLAINADGLVEGVAVMGVTLVACVAATVFGEPWTIDKNAARVGLAFYVVYLISACVPALGLP